MNRGVTVVELLLIIAVLILAGGLIKLHFLRMEERTELFEARSDLKQIRKHIEILYDHTGWIRGTFLAIRASERRRCFWIPVRPVWNVLMELFLIGKVLTWKFQETLGEVIIILMLIIFV